MAIVYNKVDIRGVAAEPIIEEILFENQTIAKSLVTFETDVKAETIFTEASATATLQQFTCGDPTSAGELSAFDTVVTPDKGMFYQTFCPDNLRFSRFKRDMAPGAYNTSSSEFERILIGGIYAKKMSLALEQLFWSGVKATTQTAVAALTSGAGQGSVGAAEKTLIASLTPVAGTLQVDGVVAKMIYNNSNATQTPALGGRIKVAGAVLTPTNIKAEFDKIYAAIPAEVLAGAEQPIIYAPKNVKQMLVTANNVVSDFNRPFQINDANTEFRFNGLLIEFVPVPNNVVIVALKSHIFWVTDLASDNNSINVDKIANNREDMFIKSIMTIGAHVANQKFNVLYVG
jgi:hypothetical protein